MVRRGFIWLMVLSAFALPQAVMPAMASAPMTHAAMADCPFHAYAPPGHHSHQKPATHAVAVCCLAMLHVVALMPTAAAQERRTPPEPPVIFGGRDLVGIAFNKDPPPPRV